MVWTRVLVAYGNEYRAYREAIAAGIRLLRPHTEVSTAAPADLGAELERFDPQVVVDEAEELVRAKAGRAGDQAPPGFIHRTS